MSVNINVTLFKKMVINGAINLKNNHKEVDELNVFPVPDGDTGTNMSMTVMSGVTELNNIESSSIVDTAKVLSRGALMGARGNSGVILSQFFRGLYVGVKDLQHDELSVEDFMYCLESGCKIAYKAVMEPVEGTILTVVRVAAEKTRARLKEINSIEKLLDVYLLEAKAALETTPELLPVLKEAGVVDSGGAGFVKIVEGMVMALNGQILEVNDTIHEKKVVEKQSKFDYCVELFVSLKKPDVFEKDDFKSAMSLLGDDIVLVRQENIIKLHIHTSRPGRVVEIAQKQGELLKSKIDNLKLGHNLLEDGALNSTEKKAPKKPFALIAVCFGEGIVSTFKDLGVDCVIEGGQTMNPSTEAFVDAIKKVNAENVIIIPNNGNVVMAAKQAASMVNDCRVEVLKAKTIAQGYVSLINFNPEGTMEENIAAMTEQIEHVVTGEVTYSIRDTEIGGVKIVAGDYMGILDGEIIVSTKERTDALKKLLSQSINEDSQIITFFCGSEVDKEEISTLEELCTEINPDLDVEIIDGKQDIYSFIIAFE